MSDKQEDTNCSESMRRHILEWQLAIFDIENIKIKYFCFGWWNGK